LESSAVAVEKGRHHLSVHLPDEKIWILGDKVRLSQVISNLLTNAAKFTEPGGEIAIDARVEDDRLFIRVSDNGIGIEQESQEQIFHLFVQSGRLSDRVQEGLGIGLSLVKTLVELHSGRIRVESAGIG